MIRSIAIILLFISAEGFAQSDSSAVVISKDPRIDQLIKKQIQINEETTRNSRRNIPGYRIQIINSSDRSQVFAIKTSIYQQYPELKPYLMYQAPNYKLKVGNFRTPEEADPYIQRLNKLFPTGIYLVHDIIEVKPEKPKEDNE